MEDSSVRLHLDDKLVLWWRLLKCQKLHSRLLHNKQVKLKRTLTEVEVTFMAFEMIDRSIVKQLKAVEGAVFHLAQTHAPLQSARSWDARAGTGRQSGCLGSVLRLSHSYRLSKSSLDFLGLCYSTVPRASCIFPSTDNTGDQGQTPRFDASPETISLHFHPQSNGQWLELCECAGFWAKRGGQQR